MVDQSIKVRPPYTTWQNIPNIESLEKSEGLQKLKVCLNEINNGTKQVSKASQLFEKKSHINMIIAKICFLDKRKKITAKNASLVSGKNLLEN